MPDQSLLDAGITAILAANVLPTDRFYVVHDVSGTPSDRYITKTELATLVGGGGSVGADLTAIEALTGTGGAYRTAGDTWALRTLTGTAGKIDITNPAGVAGNPTFTLPDNITLVTPTVTNKITVNPSGQAIESLDNALSVLGDNGGNYTKIGLQLGASGVAAGTGTPTINAQIHQRPNGSGTLFNYLFATTRHGTNTASDGNQAAIYNLVGRAHTDATAMPLTDHHDLVAVAGLAAALTGAKANVWGFYAEGSTVSVDGIATAAEFQALNESGTTAERVTSASRPQTEGLSIVGRTVNVGSLKNSAGLRFSIFTDVDDSFLDGIYFDANSIESGDAFLNVSELVNPFIDAGTAILNVKSTALALKPFNTGAGQTQELRFLELAANGSHYTAFKAADSLAQTTTYKLPSTDPTAGQLLSASAPSSGVVTLSWATDAGGTAGTVVAQLLAAVSDETTTITTGTAKLTFRMPFAMTLTGVRASLSTASSSGVVTVDINEASVSILSTKLSVDSGEKTSTTAATPAVISDTALADDAEITIDIDAAGTGAKGLKILLSGERTDGAGVFPVADTQTLVKGSGDSSKLLRFEVDGFTTGTTRVATWPDADLTVVGLATTQTLTNKTLTTPTIGDFTNAGHAHTDSAGGGQLTDAALSAAVTVPKGGSGLTSLTAFAILAGGTTSTGNLQQVSGLGTSGQVLTSNGAGALPTWQAAGGGGGGADTALSNLASVAINTSLISDTNNTDDLGSSSIGWKDIYLAGSLKKGNNSIDIQPSANVVDIIFPLAYKMRFAKEDVFGSGSFADALIQPIPGDSSGHGVLETYGSAGMVVGTGGGTSPVIFAINRSERVRVTNTTTSLFKGGDVASAAAITPTGNTFHVTGTTSITSITTTGMTAGAVIQIIFDDVLTFTDGNNLVLAGNFVTSAGDTITLVYDGTNFYELCRSVN
jgi:hypothetical protein